MNREILFRGKRIDNGEFVSGSLFVSDNGECEICTGTPRVRITWDVLPETVGQYTGLTDKNGKKIFEGDVIHVDRQGGDNWQTTVLDIRNIPDVMRGSSVISYEVIGTIHDNTELIGGVGYG